MSMSSARVSKETDSYETPHGEISTWDIFFRNPSPGKPPKIFKLGVTHAEDLAKWRAHLNEALGPPQTPPKDLLDDADLGSMQPAELDSSVQHREPKRCALTKYWL